MKTKTTFTIIPHKDGNFIVSGNDTDHAQPVRYQFHDIDTFLRVASAGNVRLLRDGIPVKSTLINIQVTLEA